VRWEESFPDSGDARRVRSSGTQAVASTSIRMSAVGSISLTSTTVEAGGSPGKNSFRTRL